MTRADEISRNAFFRYFPLRVRPYSHVRPQLFLIKHFFILPPRPLDFAILLTTGHERSGRGLAL